MEFVVRKAGLDLKFIELELTRYGNDLDGQMNYLSHLHTILENVISDFDKLFLDIGEKTKSKNIETETTPEYVQEIIGFLDKEIKDLTTPPSIAILHIIKEEAILTSYSSLESLLIDFLEEIYYVKWEVQKWLDIRSNVINLRSETFIRRIHWIKTEESLIQLFNSLIEKGFLQFEKDIYESLVIHFTLTQKVLLPQKSNIPYNKIIWNSTIKDLANLYKKLIDSKFIDSPKNVHELLVDHFTLKGKPLGHKSFRDIYNKIQSNQIDYRPSQAMQEILKSI